jgi:hypothetical protein
MKYNNQTLTEYCIEQNITLSHDYVDIVVNRDSYIEGKCVNNCCNLFNKHFRQLVKTGAYCENCIKDISSSKIRESKVKYDINMLTEFCNINNILLIDDYTNTFINRDTIIQGICLQEDCNNTFSKTFRQLLKINAYCENCSKENGKVKIIETNMKKYGVDNPMKCEELKEKQKQTTIQKYGVEHNSQLEEIKIKKINTFLNHYGVTNNLKCPKVRNQIKETNLLKYGVENPQQNKEIRDKNYKTNMEKYGVKHYIQTQEYKDKVIQTNLERYGVQHHSQNAIVADTMLKNAYNKKQYKLPSGNTILYQGYENFALDELLFVEKIKEKDIVTCRKDVPEIWYTDKNNKKRRHYVDFYITSQNRCIEVKSTWTNQEKNNVLEKQKAAQALGFTYEIWIYDKNGDKQF